jgi:hypothetical protein
MNSILKGNNSYSDGTSSNEIQAAGRVYVMKSTGLVSKDKIDAKAKAEKEESDKVKSNEAAKKRNNYNTNKANAKKLYDIEKPAADQEFLKQYGTKEQFTANEKNALDSSINDLNNAANDYTNKLRDAQKLLKNRDTLHDLAGVGLTIVGIFGTGGTLPLIVRGAATVGSIGGSLANDKLRIEARDKNNKPTTGDGIIGAAIRTAPEPVGSNNAEIQAASSTAAAFRDGTRHATVDKYAGVIDSTSALVMRYEGHVPGSEQHLGHYSNAPIKDLRDLNDTLNSAPLKPTIDFLKNKGMDITKQPQKLIELREKVAQNKEALEKKERDYSKLKTASDEAVAKREHLRSHGAFSERK